jgi:hypothetical protein
LNREKCSNCGAIISGKEPDLPLYYHGVCLCQDCFKRAVEAGEKERTTKKTNPNASVGSDGAVVI